MNYILPSPQSGIFFYDTGQVHRRQFYVFLSRGVHMTYITRPTETDMILTPNICKRKKKLVLLEEFGARSPLYSTIHYSGLNSPSLKQKRMVNPLGTFCKLLQNTGTPVSASNTNHFQGSDYRRWIPLIQWGWESKGNEHLHATGKGKLCHFSSYWFRVPGSSSSSCILTGDLSPGCPLTERTHLLSASQHGYIPRQQTNRLNRWGFVDHGWGKMSWCRELQSSLSGGMEWLIHSPELCSTTAVMLRLTSSPDKSWRKGCCGLQTRWVKRLSLDRSCCLYSTPKSHFSVLLHSSNSFAAVKL